MSGQPEKVFGVGLPRTATTSAAAAMLMLGFKTCHTCFDGTLIKEGDAFFDTPIYTDYPALDRRYPESKFILTWRDPYQWLTSFTSKVVPYIAMLREQSALPDNAVHRTNRRCLLQVFGTDKLTDKQLLDRYHQHRETIERYFQKRPQALLILDLSARSDPWDALCHFLDCNRPAAPFPHLNSGSLQEWGQIHHANKLASWR